MGFLSLALFVFMAQAEKFSYPEQKFLANGVEKIQIIGVNGHVRLTGRVGKVFRLKVRHTKNKTSRDWSLSVDRRGKTLVLEVFSVAYGAQWRAHVRKELWPEFDIQLEGPAKPITVAWRSGEMDFVNWNAPVEASQVEGKVTVQGGAGAYDLRLGQTELNIDGLSGAVTVKGESGRVRLAKITGDVDLDWVAGDVELKSIVGNGRVTGAKGELRLKSISGKWHLHWSEGQARIDEMSGRLAAEGRSTIWRINSSALREAEIKSESGPVFWDKNRGGFKVFLTSDKGEILGLGAPPITDSEGRKVSEFATGKKPFAQVFVRTDSGPIHFQQ